MVPESKPPDAAREPEGKTPASFGNISEHHWSRARKDSNQEALEHYRERSHAPGVAEGGGPRNHYCMNCNGVIPLEYDQRAPAGKQTQTCPHCGVELDPRVRAMFNWVETDQVPGSDMRVLLPVVLGGLILLLAVAGLAAWLFL